MIFLFFHVLAKNGLKLDLSLIFDQSKWFTNNQLNQLSKR